MPRKILHLDLDAFFCAVEEQRNPSLRGKPFAVGGMPGERGVISSASYPARRCGVRSAMPTSRALNLCPQLIVVASRHEVYREVSARVMQHMANLTPLVEQISIDEAFMDVSDLPQPGVEIARKLQAEIREQLGLPCSIGIATNKLVAKTATDIGKANHRSEGPPNAILEVPPGQEAAFMAPLPIQALWGIGPKTAEFLKTFGVRTIGDLPRLPEAQLAHHFGKNGPELAMRARGIDNRPVEVFHAAKSISQEVTFERDIRERKQLERTLRSLAEGVGYRLRQDKLAGSTIRIKLRWADFTTLTRQVTLDRPTDQDGIIFEAAAALFETAWPPGRPVRLLGVGVSSLGPRLRQLSLWDNSTEKEHRLLEALDDLRQRYGDQIILRGSELEDNGDR